MSHRSARSCSSSAIPAAATAWSGRWSTPHTNAIVAHELDALKYVEARFGRDQLYTLIIRHQQARVTDSLRSGSGYAYRVPDQWQGRYERLEVIGEKGGRSTVRLASRLDLFDRLTRTVGLRVKVVQVVRDPYDNIATMYRRGHRRCPSTRTVTSSWPVRFARFGNGSTTTSSTSFAWRTPSPSRRQPSASRQPSWD